MKKAIIVVLILALVAGISISGTMAWLQDDDSSKNTMVVGNVKIDQHEYERVKNEDGSYKTDTFDNQTSYVLKEFHQSNTGHPIYPATIMGNDGKPYSDGAGPWDSIIVRMTQVGSPASSAQVFASQNAIDEVITVENTGDTDAYVRTLVAIEVGNLPAERHRSVIEWSAFMNKNGVWAVDGVDVVNIKGNNYRVLEFVYGGAAHLGGVHANGVLPAGETSYPSLVQLYMKAGATNEDCKNIDGNNNGLLDVLVISQAVQAAGFADAKTALDTAFGDVTADTAPAMFEEAASKIVTGEDLKDAIENGDGNITLDGDIDLSDPNNPFAGLFG